MMARKAGFLSMEVSFLKYRQLCLKFAPDWLGFATESERIEYERITEAIQNIENETDALLKGALRTAQKAGDKKVEAHAWMPHAALSCASLRTKIGLQHIDASFKMAPGQL